MELQLILSLISGVVAVAGAMMSVATVWLKARAERQYLHRLVERRSAIREIRNRAMRDGVITPDELQQLIACLEKAAEGMPVAQRRLIAEGLHQRSMRGRARYAAKLMNKAGIGSGYLPVPTP
jgi:hypothetical protein